MDWLRRNWPDLAIGVALVAVIGGIIATLLTGGSFFPSATAPTDPPAVSAPVTTPPADSESATAGEPTADTDADTAAAEPTTEPAASEAAPVQPGVAVLAPDGTPVDDTAAAPTPQVEALAPAPPAPATPPAAAAPAPAPAAPATPAPAAPAPAPAPAAAAPAATGPLPSASSDPEAPYRVSVGAFGNPDNAARQAETFRAAGFPVFTGTQGDLTIVLVGPYASEADAAAVATRIRAGAFGIDPVIYRFEPDAPSAASATPAPQAAAATPTPAAAPAAPTPPAPASAPSSGERYLQVGAFASAESAQPLRTQLAALGYATRDVSEDGLVKVLVGPFDAAALQAARSRLDAEGIQSFPR